MLRSSRSLHHGAVFAFFAVLSLAMTWPLARHLPTHVVKAKWYYDSMVNLHVLGSRVHYFFGNSPGLQSVYDNYFCAPTPFSIANNENHFGLSLLFAPFYLLTGDPLLAYNLLLLLCLSLSGFFTYLFVRKLTDSPFAAVLAGVAFAFCPYILFELGRVQLVAAQWMPLFALFLHRSAEQGRVRDVFGLALTFAMQVGTCLYYALFLVVYAVVVGTWLLVRRGHVTRRFLLGLAGAGALAAVLVAGMVYPNFRAKRDFDLTRTQDLAARYAGKLEHLTSVYPENKALSFLHDPAIGPTEPIAFPGLTILFLAVVALTAPVIAAYRRSDAQGRRNLLKGALLFFFGTIGVVGVSVALHTFLAGLLLASGLAWWWRRTRTERVVPPLTATYAALLALSVILFLGPTPFTVGDAPIQGLYYYLYRYVPGFDGIRYVSRFSILAMFALVVLGGYGAALLLIRAGRARTITFVVLLVAMLSELRNAPVTLARLPHRAKLPAVYTWLAKHPGPEPIATMPAYPYGYFGARNDYFALYHRRRTIDGKSSWMPPITHAYIMETRRFPRATGTRMLQALGVKYLVLHLEEFKGARRQRTLDWIDHRPNEYKKRFASGDQVIYEVLPPQTDSVSLLEAPERPKNAVLVSRAELSGTAIRGSELASNAFDGVPHTKWTSGRTQVAGDWFEIELTEPRKIAAIEFTKVRDAFETPSAYQISVADGAGGQRVLMTQPHLRFYRDQVYHPKTFVFRAVLPEPTVTDAVRIELLDGVAGREWVIHEVNVWALP